MTPEEKLKANSRKLIMVQILEAPAALMLALGLNAKFAANGEPLFAFLQDGDTVNTLLIAGGGLLALGVIKTVSVLLEKKQILKEIQRRQ